MAITLQGVTKVFGSQRAVDDVSFSVAPGITGFLGPNGAGKSTTMRMITGFLEPSAGNIELNGRPVWPSTPALRNQVGYLPEHNPLYTDMYVREYLAFVAGLHGIPQAEKRVDEVIELVGLGLEQRKKIRMLSKGYRQRVGLAQAVIHDPPVLILDEPTSGLDPNQLKEIREVIREMGRTKIVLLSTHIMQEVQALCERVLIINRGKLVADDGVAQLAGRLAGESRVFLECQQAPVAKLLQTVPGVTAVDVRGTHVTVTSAGDTDLRATLAEFVMRQGWGLLELRREAASVEDAFAAITRQNQPA